MNRSFIWHARIPVRLRSGGVLAAGVAVAMLATTGVAVASDAVGGPATTAPIRACFQPGTPTAPLQVLTRQHASCPTGDRRLTWNKVGPQGPPGTDGAPGPQGPPGLSTGVTAGKNSSVPIDAGPNTPVTVLTGPAVPTSGIYYLTASITIEVAGGDFVACAAVPNQTEPQTAQFGAVPANVSVALAVNGALAIPAGQAPSIICIDANSDPNTSYLEGSLSATLINSSNGAAASAQARPGRFPLKIVTSAK